MVIRGGWVKGDDGITRPVIDAWVPRDAARPLGVRFLIDTGADCTAFSEAILRELDLPTVAPSGEFALLGVGGGSPFVIVKATLEPPQPDGRMVKLHGDYAAFTDPSAVDLSVLGRDVLDLFDVILSRRRDEIVLVGGAHRYRIVSDGRS